MMKVDKNARSVVENVLHQTRDITDDEDRLAIMVTMAIQGIYCIAIELEEQSLSKEERSLMHALKMTLDALALIAPGTIQAVTPKGGIAKETLN